MKNKKIDNFAFYKEWDVTPLSIILKGYFIGVVLFSLVPFYFLLEIINRSSKENTSLFFIVSFTILLFFVIKNEDFVKKYEERIARKFINKYDNIVDTKDELGFSPAKSFAKMVANIIQLEPRFKTELVKIYVFESFSTPINRSDNMIIGLFNRKELNKEFLKLFATLNDPHNRFNDTIHFILAQINSDGFLSEEARKSLAEYHFYLYARDKSDVMSAIKSVMGYSVSDIERMIINVVEDDFVIALFNELYFIELMRNAFYFQKYKRDPYKITISYDEGYFTAVINEISEDIVGVSENREKAISFLINKCDGHVRKVIKDGDYIPEPNLSIIEWLRFKVGRLVEKYAMYNYAVFLKNNENKKMEN